jgi:hypothetical protein
VLLAGGVWAADDDASDVGLNLTYAWKTDTVAEATLASTFTLDARTGAITLAASGAVAGWLNFESSRRTQVLTVIVTDTTGRKDSASVVVELDAGDPTSLTQQLERELQDRVTVNDTVIGTTGDYIIEAVEHEISEGGNRFITRFTLSRYGVEAITFAADAATSPVVFAPPDGTVTFTTCTSGTRPASPTDGDYIFETDTGLYFERDSGEWLERVYPRFTY